MIGSICYSGGRERRKVVVSIWLERVERGGSVSTPIIITTTVRRGMMVTRREREITHHCVSVGLEGGAVLILIGGKHVNDA
jgi:hypothetical protein